MIRVYTKDGKYFKFTEYDFDKQIGILKDIHGKICSQVYFYNDSIIAVEKSERDNKIE